MKKNFFALVAVAVSLFVAINEVSAQKNNIVEKALYEKSNDGMGRALAPSNYEAINAGDISPKAVKEFGKNYQYATAESWEKLRDGYSVKFISDDVINRIYYNTSGKWEGSLKGYSEDKMPAEVRKIVKREYYDYSITYVNEAQTVDSRGIPTYIVHLEDKSTIKLMRIYDGVMDTFMDFKKP